MNKRKNIACITIRPEAVYQQRVLNGLISQCNIYGYNLSVFSPFVDISHFFTDYLNGELNILNLINYDQFDAVVITPVPFIANGDSTFINGFLDKLRKECKKPIISLDYEFEGLYSVFTDDKISFKHITEHILDEHKCEKVYFLTGKEGFEISELRLSGFLEVYKERNISVNKDYIFYGDFWYTSGEALAERIASGELEKPDAVICASDHMAIGLVNALVNAGYKVPEDIIVTGYDTSQEAITNSPSITTYIPEVSAMSARAVNLIRGIIETEEEVYPVSDNVESGLFIGGSCGCNVDAELHKKHLFSSLYRKNRNYGDNAILNNEDFGGLMESYMTENLTQAKSPLESLKLIYAHTYLLNPYKHFYMCLRPDWLDTESKLKTGYPDQMRCVIHSVPENSCDHVDSIIHCRNDNRDIFDTKLMYPDYNAETDEAQVCYYAPIHFSDDTLGYCVLVSNIKSVSKSNCVFRNWVRNVNIALEMIRIQNQLISYSLVDSMTKLNNRRGMEMRINDLLCVAEPDDKVLAMVIDMDGLKHINDTYGHNEGDYAIMTIASVVRCITEGSEVCSRAGGDEFYILGVGKYTDDMLRDKITRFYNMIAEQNKISVKPFEVTGSIGYSIMPVSEVTSISPLIARADLSMYTSKLARRKKR